MGMDPVSLGLVGGAVASGVGGAAKGAKGTPDQKSITSFSQAGQKERNLQQQSLQNYMQQQNLQNQMEQGLGSADELQGAARSGVMDLLSGQSLQITPQEQANINALRDSLVQQGTTDVNRMLDDRLSKISQSAGSRGLRGQAVSELQGRQLQASAAQLGDFQRQANQIAAQETINSPYRRISAQAPFLQQGVSFADQLRNNAQQNRQILQNPAMLQALRGERMAASTTTVPGQQGSFGDALLGGFGGAVGGAGIGSNLIGGFQNIGAFGMNPWNSVNDWR